MEYVYKSFVGVVVELHIDRTKVAGSILDQGSMENFSFFRSSRLDEEWTWLRLAGMNKKLSKIKQMAPNAFNNLYLWDISKWSHIQIWTIFIFKPTTISEWSLKAISQRYKHFSFINSALLCWS